MPNALGFLGLMLGLDSLAVGFGLGATLPRKQRLWLALAFGACDGLASLVGWASRAELRASLEWGGWLGPMAVAGYGALILCLAWRGRRLLEGGGRLALLVPVCLSLDNLVAGTGPEMSLLPALLTALAFAAVSGALAMAGLWLGAVVAERARPRAGWLAGSALLAVAAALALKEVLI